MGFRKTEKVQLLALHGVGETVIRRLEEMGFSSLSELSNVDPEVITKNISEMLGSTCWHNSPHARKAIAAVVNLANQGCKKC